MSTLSRNRLTSRTLAAMAVAGALAGFGAATSSASTLDLQPNMAAATTPIVAESYLRNDNTTLFASDASNPIYRRRPRYRDRYDDGYDRRPRTFATLGIGGFDPADQPGSGFFGSASVGTELESPIDLGVKLDWYHRSTGGEQFVSTFTDPAGNQGTRVIQADKISTDLVPLMAFLRVKFPAGSVEPYVGAGAGWEWLHVSGVDSDGFDFADDYDGFGAQFFGGANFKIAPNTALYGEVLYNKSTVKADFFDTVSGQDVRDEISMDGAAAHGGLRFRF
jgi:outer membrane protein with beta-barrel domain